MPPISTLRLQPGPLVTAFFLVVFGASCTVGFFEEIDENRRGGVDKPEPPPVLANLSFEGDVVSDRETSLTWQRTPAEGRFTFAQARSHCLALGGGWRLPTRDELLTVLHHRQDPVGAPPDWYWSASEGMRADTAWALGLNAWMNGAPVEARNRVRCVRSSAVPEGGG